MNCGTDFGSPLGLGEAARLPGCDCGIGGTALLVPARLM
jgi:hypothetical protein